MLKKISSIIFVFLFVASVFSANNANNSKIYMKKSQIDLGDGDTFAYNGNLIRVLGVDTPEVKNPEYGIMTNQYLGREASEFTRLAIKNAKSVSYIPYKKDRYDRTLAHVFIDDELLSVKLIEAGLGYETVSFYGDNGFVKFAKQITDAADKVGRLNFMNPMYWRRKNVKKK